MEYWEILLVLLFFIMFGLTVLSYLSDRKAVKKRLEYQERFINAVEYIYCLDLHSDSCNQCLCDVVDDVTQCAIHCMKGDEK